MWEIEYRAFELTVKEGFLENQKPFCLKSEHCLSRSANIVRFSFQSKLKKYIGTVQHIGQQGMADLGSIPSIPKKISEEKIVAVTVIILWHCLEESGQWLENVE